MLTQPSIEHWKLLQRWRDLYNCGTPIPRQDCECDVCLNYALWLRMMDTAHR